MAVKTVLEQLEEVQTAISAVMNGQEVSRGGKKLTMADLDALTRREQMLLARYNNDQGAGLACNRGIMRRD